MSRPVSFQTFCTALPALAPKPQAASVHQIVSGLCDGLRGKNRPCSSGACSRNSAVTKRVAAAFVENRDGMQRPHRHRRATLVCTRPVCRRLRGTSHISPPPRWTLSGLVGLRVHAGRPVAQTSSLSSQWLRRRCGHQSGSGAPPLIVEPPLSISRVWKPQTQQQPG